MSTDIKLEHSGIQAAQNLWGRLSPDQKADYMVLVYRLLLNRHPEYKSIFSTELEPVRDNMTDTINYLVAHLEQPDKMQPVFNCLGVKHKDMNITAEMFPQMVACMVDALDEFYAGSLSGKDLEHWRKIMSFLAAGIMQAYPQ